MWPPCCSCNVTIANNTGDGIHNFGVKFYRHDRNRKYNSGRKQSGTNVIFRMALGRSRPCHLGNNLSDDSQFAGGSQRSSKHRSNDWGTTGQWRKEHRPTPCSSGSPAIDAGNNDLALDLTFDQREAGYQRIFDGNSDEVVASVDIGAFESAITDANVVVAFAAGTSWASSFIADSDHDRT